ncbi:hypothetical protein [Arthrobacter sp. HMWF013]|uniref:hypothetical protein n=1 Tax=Arthrobacter sp. HMWF013 TaxID=2056849 RepID=UPI000D3AE3A0|nr:hypothetical protein [Arthrobacter sp. HMWF013]PTT64570.1 hypothetical protein DBR22_13845 [Arthrobacter sp. HMWF013]
MSTSHYQHFLDEATIFDPTSDCPLGPDCLYGLYVSWCFLKGFQPHSDAAFRAAMQRCGIDMSDSKLMMHGPAAAEYILASYPAVA